MAVVELIKYESGVEGLIEVKVVHVAGYGLDVHAVPSTTRNCDRYVGVDGHVTMSVLATNSSKFQLRTDFVRFTISY